MARLYEGMTAAEIVSDVMAHGLSTTQEDICTVQDIFGHTAIEELDRLANDIGRNNENGEPDPKGTWSSGRRGTRDTFYMILFNIWNWEDATRFWNQHSNPERDELLELRKTCKEWAEQCDKQDKTMKVEHERRLKETKGRIDAEKKADRLESELYDRDMQIMELKAKLYDMLMKEAC